MMSDPQPGNSPQPFLTFWKGSILAFLGGAVIGAILALLQG